MDFIYLCQQHTTEHVKIKKKKGPSKTLIENALQNRCSRSTVIVKQCMVAVNCMISKPTHNPIQEKWWMCVCVGIKWTDLPFLSTVLPSFHATWWGVCLSLTHCCSMSCITIHHIVTIAMNAASNFLHHICWTCIFQKPTIHFSWLRHRGSQW